MHALRAGFRHAPVIALLFACASCMRATPAAQRGLIATAPPADSVTVLLWPMDEAGGDRAADAGRNRLDAIAGQDTRIDFGRYHNARVFDESVESFLYAPYGPSLDSPLALTVEAWIYPTGYGDFEDTPIVGRWTETPNGQSWLFSVVGRRPRLVTALVQSPGYHLLLTQAGGVGRLMFAIQPEEASLPLVTFSTQQIDLERWTHVAVTFDGRLVRFYVDGRLDAQFALGARIRSSQAPILAGNYFDTRWLTDFGGTLRVGGTVDRNPYYAFRGRIDELRISRVARTEFPTAGR
jgi:hypothetical protein